jgi:agmatine deiminase
MPAEWERHTATWIVWPQRSSDWPGKLSVIPWVYAEIVRHLLVGERVRVIVGDSRVEARARRVLCNVGGDLSRVDFFRVPTNRGWIRDSGPIFVVSRKGALAMLDWGFNAWAKYSDWQKDNALPGALRTHLRLPRCEPCLNGRRIVLEGGSIDVNGQGLLMTTEECLLDPVQARNPGLSRQQIEQFLQEFLGVQKVLWLGRGIAGDDTHGHVDDLARFVGPRTVVAAVEEDPSDPNYEPLQDNLRRLQSMTDGAGRPLEIVPLPMPQPLWFDGQRLPASYANFYISNQRILVPTFNDPRDRQALGVFADFFPGRTVVGIHAVDLVLGLGTIHCLTQQQPDPTSED